MAKRFRKKMDFLLLFPSAVLAAHSAFAAEIGAITTFSSEGGALELNLTAVKKDVTIGGDLVTQNDSLVLCDKSGARCADPYVGGVLKLKPNDKLILNLENQLPGNGAASVTHCMVASGGAPNTYATDSSLVNLHTHGLIVSPYKKTSGGKTIYGDNIFDCTTSKSAGGSVVGSKMRYEIALDDTAPGKAHPLGVDWVHPHVHGIAKAQVSSGMASMIVVGDINKQLCAMPSPDGEPSPSHCVRNIPDDTIKHLLLKDAQIVKTKDHPDRFTNYADQNPDFCGNNKTAANANGECSVDLGVLADDNVIGGKWTFTVNGAKTPHWDIQPDKYELWRVQNASANVTYNLSLQTQINGVATKASFQVLDMDGAGLAGAVATPKPLPSTTDILLMPGSRADLLVQSPRETTADTTYTLINDNYQAGFAPDDADIWPHIALATVTFKASKTFVAALGSAAPAALAEFHHAHKQIDEDKLRNDLPNQCQGFDDTSLTDDQKKFYAEHLHVSPPWKRRVYFGILGDRFVLGDTLVNDNGEEFDKFGRKIPDAQPVKLFDFQMSDARTPMCVRKHPEDEIWQLVNVSNEVHNFHIHQMKYSVVRRQNGDISWRAQSPIDKVGLPTKLLFKKGELELDHDTIVVPRGQTNCLDSLSCPDGSSFCTLKRDATNACTGTGAPEDISGMIEIKLNFDGSAVRAFDDGAGAMKNAKFVYHCHILEHEDKGMMAGITVVDPSIYH